MSLSLNLNSEQDASTGVFSISESSFICIAQNSLINLLMKTTDKKSDIVKIQDDYYKYKSSESDCTVLFQSLKSIDLRLFLFFVSKLCSLINTKNRADKIKLSVKEYQELTDSKSYTNTIEQMKESLARLNSVTLNQGSFSCKLFESVKTERSSFIIAYDKKFLKLISDEKQAFLIYLPASLFKINLQKNELAFFVCYKLFVFNRCRLSHRNKKRNSQKQDAYKISLNTLIEACPNLPIGNKHTTQRIAKPVEDALEALRTNIQILKNLDIEESDEKENFNGWKKKFVSFSFADYISEKQKDCLPKMFHKPRKKKQNNLSVSVGADEELRPLDP